MALLALLHAGKLIDNLSSLGSMKRAIYPDATKYYQNRNFNQLIRRLEKQGYIKNEYKETKRILKLTKKGELKALFKNSQATQPNPETWDGEWTVFCFDTPEHARIVRSQIRQLLRSYGFKAIQASVYISPYKLAPEAMLSLKESGLDRYICIFRAKQISNAKKLSKLFNLPLASQNERPSKK